MTLLGWLQATSPIALMLAFVILSVVEVRYDRRYTRPRAERIVTIARIRRLEAACGLEPWYDDFWYDLEKSTSPH